MNENNTTSNASPAKLGHTFLPLKQNFPFSACPPFVELEDERILCNDVRLPHDRMNIHNVRLFVIGHVFGAVCAVWADCEQDAMDAMVDENLGDSFLVSEADQASADEDEREQWAHLGNAGEPADLSDAWMGKVDMSKLDCATLCRFAEARGACNATLAD